METAKQPIEEKTDGRILIRISILMVCLIMVFLLWWMNHGKSVSENETETNTVIEVPTNTEPTALELRGNFSTLVAVLIQDIPKMDIKNSSELISAVEDKLMAIRVPSDSKERYLNVFLAIDNLKKNEIDSVEMIKTKIIELITQLLQSP